MKIKIKVKQTILLGEKRIRILKITCRGGEELPLEYTDGNYVYAEGDMLFFRESGQKHNRWGLGLGDCLSEELFVSRLEQIGLCVEKLEGIKKRVKKEKKDLELWRKTLTYTI